MGTKVLITGSNSGFGNLIANTLLKNNYTVIASMRDPQGRNQSQAKALADLGATVVNIDVANDVSVGKGVQQAIESTGGIDVLINNAGIGMFGWQETFTTEDFKEIFDVNVFGVQRMTHAVLPYMKQQKNGTIIQISSLLGKMVLPFFGPYNATKHAVEAIAENYRVELSNYGIDSLVVQPGGFGTNFNGSMLNPSDQERVKSYGEAASAPQQMLEQFEENYASDNAPNPQMVADAVLTLLNTPKGHRPFRTTVDGLGMSEHVDNINAITEEAMQGIYSAFDMQSLFKVV